MQLFNKCVPLEKYGKLLYNVQSGHIYEKLKSPESSLRFPGHFQVFPEQLWRENSLEYIFIRSYVTFLHFP